MNDSVTPITGLAAWLLSLDGATFWSTPIVGLAARTAYYSDLADEEPTTEWEPLFVATSGAVWTITEAKTAPPVLLDDSVFVGITPAGSDREAALRYLARGWTVDDPDGTRADPPRVDLVTAARRRVARYTGRPNTPGSPWRVVV